MIGHSLQISKIRGAFAQRAMSSSSAQRARRTQRRPQTSVQAFFNFNKNNGNSSDNGPSRSDFDFQEVEDYFNYMGMLAAEGNYDKLDALCDSGLEPVDLLLLMACSEDDTPKVEELLGAGADVTVKNPADGKTPMELCTKEEIKNMLSAAAAAAAA